MSDNELEADAVPAVCDDTWPGPRITLEAFGREIERRRAELGYPEMPRNSGTRRTASKRALLAAIEAAGGKW